ncbi:NUDIX hydrolase [Halorussus halophilus]|uniref:NUDIX hydrolase n=1 Tax=Halorussus halophilus TaxID=2650975 RepID=UPI00130107F6|nr:NUDIX domain-containing protein [Halorussus halophilus]
MTGEDHVASKLAEFRDRYDEFEVTTREGSIPTEEFETRTEKVRARSPFNARVLVERDGEVLLVRDHDWPGFWVEPGGTVESGEAIEQATRREITEETGIECRLTDLRGVVHFVGHDEADETKEVHLLQAFYWAEHERGDLDVQEEEIVEGRWWQTLPEEFHSNLGVPDGRFEVS